MSPGRLLSLCILSATTTTGPLTAPLWHPGTRLIPVLVPAALSSPCVPDRRPCACRSVCYLYFRPLSIAARSHALAPEVRFRTLGGCGGVRARKTAPFSGHADRTYFALGVYVHVIHAKRIQIWCFLAAITDVRDCCFCLCDNDKCLLFSGAPPRTFGLLWLWFGAHKHLLVVSLPGMQIAAFHRNSK